MVDGGLPFTRGQLLAILHDLPIGVVVAEASSGAVLFRNARARELGDGRWPGPNDIQADAAPRADSPEHSDPEPIGLALAEALAGKQTDGQAISLPGPDGSTADARMRAATINDGDGSVVAATLAVSEIAGPTPAEREHTRLLEIVRAAEERYRRLFDAAADAVIVVDEEGRLLDVNAMAVRLLGYSREELLVRQLEGADGLLQSAATPSEAEPRPDRPAPRWHGELELRCKDGSVVTVESRVARVELASQVVYQATWRDISERRALEQLREELLEPVLHELMSPVETAQLVGSSHQLRFDGPVRLPRGDWDRDRIEQVIDNLLSNAIKYTPQGTIVTVAVEDLGEGVQVSVHDDGLGIPAHEQGRIFQQFARGEAAQRTGAKGLGLGLAVSKALIEAHGGTIWVESEPGAGTTFRVTLPNAAP